MPIPQHEVSLYRAALRDVSDLALVALTQAWDAVNPSDATGAQHLIAEALSGIIPVHYSMASSVAADWYDLMRLDNRARGRFSAILPDPPDANRAVALAGWGVGPLFSASPAPDVALSKLSGGLQRVVTNAARDTVTVSSVRDPARPGWTRVGTGGCDYCRERIGVHVTTEAAFSTHDACGCIAVPAF